MIIRKAEIKDLPKLTDIYNHEILNGTATFDRYAKSIDDRKIWFDEHNKANHPLIVAEENDTVFGYASLSPFNRKDAYAQSVELSLYVDGEQRGKHIGSSPMKEIITIAEKDPLTKKIISIITSDNEISIAIHKKFGFEFCGRLTNIAVKFGRSLNIDYYSLDV